MGQQGGRGRANVRRLEWEKWWMVACMEWCKFFLKPNNHAQVALEAAASASAKNAA
jgi:hypothetical protein